MIPLSVDLNTTVLDLFHKIEGLPSFTPLLPHLYHPPAGLSFYAFSSHSFDPISTLIEIDLYALSQLFKSDFETFSPTSNMRSTLFVAGLATFASAFTQPKDQTWGALLTPDTSDVSQ